MELMKRIVGLEVDQIEDERDTFGTEVALNCTMAIRPDDRIPWKEMEFGAGFIDLTHVPTVDGEEQLSAAITSQRRMYDSESHHIADTEFSILLNTGELNTYSKGKQKQYTQTM